MVAMVFRRVRAIADGPVLADPDPVLLASRASDLIRAYESTGQMSTLAEAITLLRAVADATPTDHLDLAACLSALGVALRRLFERTGEIRYAEEAVEVGRASLDATSAGHPDRASRLADLGAAQFRLSERTGEIERMRKAAEIARAVVDVTPVGHPESAGRQSMLGLFLLRLFERTAQADLLAEAIEAGRAAAAATPVGHHARAGHLSNLGLSLLRQFESSGDTGLLAEAVDAQRAAVDATPANHPNRAIYLNALGIALLRMFERSGRAEILAEAIDVERVAADATPADHPDRAGRLSNLSLLLLRMFEQSGDTDLLAEAVSTARGAVDAVPAGHPDHAPHQSGLASALHSLSNRTGEVAWLEEAVELAREVLDAAPARDPNRAVYLSAMGSSLRDLAERTGESDRLAEAIDAGRAAVDATPAGHPNRAGYLASLGISLVRLSDRTQNVQSLADAIDVGLRAVADTPAGHPERAAYMSYLGLCLCRMFDHTGDAQRLQEARACYVEAAEDDAGAALTRINAYRQVARLAREVNQDSGVALQAMEAAIMLAQLLAPGSLGRADRQYRLAQLSSLAGHSAAAAVSAGRPERAVELLEQTRGMLAAESLAVRVSGLTRLREAAPDLADSVEAVRARLDALEYSRFGPSTAIPAASAAMGDTDEIRRAASAHAAARRDACRSWNQILDQVRAVDGFAGFLNPPPAAELSAQASDGPVVFVYTSPARCDALILTGDPQNPVRVVPLPDLTQHDAYLYANRIRAARRAADDPEADPAARTAGQAGFLEILARLWDTITGPVLAALGHAASPANDDVWPRIWWCPVGVLAFLPLHAAGHHADHASADRAPGSFRTVLDRVVSSYITTMRNLTYARTNNITASTAVIVAVPDVPGQMRLPGVKAEAKAISALIRGADVLPHPTRDAVLTALREHAVVHLACHGHANWTDPAASHLVLYDFADTPLTVADISTLHLTGALAFLSACDTGTTTDTELADESIHITGAFHLVGYQHVIGTLWPVNDRTAAKLATDFYTQLTCGGTTAPDTSRSAQALHQASRHLRSRYPDHPTVWAAHTHTGP